MSGYPWFLKISVRNFSIPLSLVQSNFINFALSFLDFLISRLNTLPLRFSKFFITEEPIKPDPPITNIFLFEKLKFSKSFSFD